MIEIKLNQNKICIVNGKKQMKTENNGGGATASPPLSPTISKHRAKLSMSKKDGQLAVQTCIFEGQPDIFCIAA
jgi:hypothetical protein